MAKRNFPPSQMSTRAPATASDRRRPSARAVTGSGAPCAPLEKRPPAGTAREPSLRHHAAPPQEDVHGRAPHGAPFVRVVVDLHVVGRGADGHDLRRVPDDEVGVGAGLEAPLPRIEPEELGGRGRDEIDEAVRGEPAPVHAAVIEQEETGLDPGRAVRDLGEVAAPEILAGGAGHAERAVVGGDHLERVGGSWRHTTWTSRRAASSISATCLSTSRFFRWSSGADASSPTEAWMSPPLTMRAIGYLLGRESRRWVGPP